VSKNRVSIVVVAIAIACLALANLACSASGSHGCQPGNAVSATTGADCSQGSTSSTNAAAQVFDKANQAVEKAANLAPRFHLRLAWRAS